MANRNNSLDALRGYSIITMVLSGSIAFGSVLPAWMFHAQVPPPGHRFDPTIPGITWVDLVFPFFLFCMGAAIPLAFQKPEAASARWWQVAWVALRRWLLLTWFALFTFHMRPWVLSDTPALVHYLLSIAVFGMLFLQLYTPADKSRSGIWRGIKAASLLLSALLMWMYPFNGGEGFDLYKSDIIILVLANMAFFGTLAWWFTRNRPWWRLAILPFIMAVFLGSKTAGSWNEWLFNFSPLPWMYKFYYLKYLFIILPATFAGEWLMESGREEWTISAARHRYTIGLGWVCTAVVVMNVCFLFSRQLVLNLVLTLLLLAVAAWILQRAQLHSSWMCKCFAAGACLLLTGLSFEAFEGGIKKDPSTYSYYFVTTGMAMLVIVAFSSWQSTRAGDSLFRLLVPVGRNPMVAYVAGNLLLIPLLHLAGFYATWNDMNGSEFSGFMKGVLFTGLVALLTIWFTKKGWYWKT